ncbi:MAG: response regulator transcription factor [Chloroflexota bacterium]
MCEHGCFLNIMQCHSQTVMKNRHEPLGPLRRHAYCSTHGEHMLRCVPTPKQHHVSAASIVVIEDDPVMSRTLSKALEASGHRVLAAAKGADACVLLGQVQADLIILDLMLPDADGLTLSVSLRTLTSAPIVICSARQGQIDRVLALKLGAADFVTKPFELEELEAGVQRVLQHARATARQGLVA